MHDIVKYAIFERPKLVEAVQEVGINRIAKQLEREGLALVFPVGLKGAEEKMLSVVNAVFDHDGFTIFEEWGVRVYIKPDTDFFMQKENIFEGTDKKVKITKADAESRIVFEMDGKRATQVYAEKIGVSERTLQQHFSKYPLGRKFKDDHLIASPFRCHEDGSIEIYCQVYEGAILEVLQPKNAEAEMKKTSCKFNLKLSCITSSVYCQWYDIIYYSIGAPISSDEKWKVIILFAK